MAKASISRADLLRKSREGMYAIKRWKRKHPVAFWAAAYLLSAILSAILGFCLLLVNTLFLHDEGGPLGMVLAFLLAPILFAIVGTSLCALSQFSLWLYSRLSR